MSFNIFQYLFHHLFDILQFVSSLFIPFTMLWISSKITKTIERKKLDALKEKEWQVKWADMFLELAIEFNEHVSSAICNIFFIQQDSKKGKNVHNDMEKLGKTLKRLSELDWHLKIYTHFSKIHGSEINDIQKKILDKMQEFIDTKKINTEEVKDLQIEYNTITKKVHAEILEFGEEYKTKYYKKNKII